IELSVRFFNKVDKQHPKFSYRGVFGVHVHSSFKNGLKPKHNLALLKTKRSFPDEYHIKICPEQPELGTILGTCGLGSTSIGSQETATTLREAYFIESVFESTLAEDEQSCRPDTICTEDVSGYGANLCWGDIGNPLYTINCGTGQPVCLLGVASYIPWQLNSSIDSTKDKSICSSGGVFTRVSLYSDWMSQIMRDYRS
ncbi:uncharacterized protein LOC142355374, partial [Convolutriloba macropyga]|uniref:uncharacterized protein LOC142355374 n=1 Tax=Convolutriloba macropyga TaxID=536237 RepID=UPI003F527E6C